MPESTPMVRLMSKAMPRGRPSHSCLRRALQDLELLGSIDPLALLVPIPIPLTWTYCSALAPEDRLLHKRFPLADLPRKTSMTELKPEDIEHLADLAATVRSRLRVLDRQ